MTQAINFVAVSSPDSTHQSGYENTRKYVGYIRQCVLVTPTSLHWDRTQTMKQGLGARAGVSVL